MTTGTGTKNEMPKMEKHFINSQLDKVVKELQLKKKALAVATGTEYHYVYMLLGRQKSQPSVEFIHKLCLYSFVHPVTKKNVNINAEYLLGLSKQMFKASQNVTDSRLREKVGISYADLLEKCNNLEDQIELYKEKTKYLDEIVNLLKANKSK